MFSIYVPSFMQVYQAIELSFSSYVYHVSALELARI